MTSLVFYKCGKTLHRSPYFFFLPKIRSEGVIIVAIIGNRGPSKINFISGPFGVPKTLSSNASLTRHHSFSVSFLFQSSIASDVFHHIFVSSSPSPTVPHISSIRHLVDCSTDPSRPDDFHQIPVSIHLPPHDYYMPKYNPIWMLVEIVLETIHPHLVVKILLESSWHDVPHRSNNFLVDNSRVILEWPTDPGHESALVQPIMSHSLVLEPGRIDPHTILRLYIRLPTCYIEDVCRSIGCCVLVLSTPQNRSRKNGTISREETGLMT